jgi:hypothetical protein
MPDPGRWWVPTYRLLGVDVAPETVRRNFEEYLEFCIDRLS